MYEMSAPYFDLILAETGRDLGVEAATIASEIRKRQPKAASLLDAPCLSGEIDRYLSWSFGIDGIERNESFLEQARGKNPHGSYHFGDPRSFDLGKSYDAILCLSGAVAFLGGPADLASVLDRFSRHLGPGGLVLMEPSFDASAWKGEDSPVSLLIHSKAPVRYIKLSRYAKEGRYATLTEHHLYSEAARVQHFVESARLYLFTRDEVEAAFRSRGFEVEVLPGRLGGRDLYVGTYTGTLSLAPDA